MADSPGLDVIANALADPVRVRILDLLARGRKGEMCSPENPDAPVAVCACDVRTAMGGIAPSKLAYHLRILREAGLVTEQPRGKWVYYTVDRDAFGAFLAAVGQRFLAQPRPSGAAGRGRRLAR